MKGAISVICAAAVLRACAAASLGLPFRTYGGEVAATALERGIEALAAAGGPGGFDDMATGFFSAATESLATSAGAGGAASLLRDHNPVPDSYYRWIPLFQDALSITNTSAVVSLPSRCFHQNVFQITSVTDTEIDISVVASGKNFTLLCDDLWLLGTVSTASVLKVDKAGSYSVKVARNDARPAGAGDWLQREGVRIFSFLEGETETAASLVSTAQLFVPALTEKTLDDASAARNVKFVHDYANISMPERAEWSKGKNGYLGLDLSNFKSGDIFVVSRPDGLGTLEDWGTGAGSTHIVMTWRFADNPDLVYAIESTDTTSYWPNPNVQKTELGKWLTQYATNANYTIAWLPLRADLRAKIDEVKAEEWIAYMLGQPYGYATFLFTFVDTPRENWPWPASPEAIELLASWVGDISPAAADKIFNRALNVRVGGKGLTTAQCSNEAATKLGMTFGELFAIPESDDTVYDDGVNLVCDSFACSVWKKAGVFGDIGDKIQCAEFTNRAVYSLDFYDTSVYPAECNTADPAVPYCLILGRYQLDLRPFNTLTPYAHMEERCPTVPEAYERPAGC